jgi:hypothetical protein
MPVVGFGDKLVIAEKIRLQRATIWNHFIIQGI